MEGVIGVVTCFAANFAPKNWATCNGQTMSISQNQAMFAILGTTYGGNGISTFNLPDLRGRTAVSAGQGNGLSNYTLGQLAGTESASMLQVNMPAHTHTGTFNSKLAADSNTGSQKDAEFGYPAQLAGAYATTPTANTNMTPPGYAVVIGNAGNTQPFPVRSPYLAVNYIICLYGIFPSRN